MKDRLSVLLLPGGRGGGKDHVNDEAAATIFAGQKLKSGIVNFGNPSRKTQKYQDRAIQAEYVRIVATTNLTTNPRFRNHGDFVDHQATRNVDTVSRLAPCSLNWRKLLPEYCRSGRQGPEVQILSPRPVLPYASIL
jgi:hypothetical protein